MKQLRDPAFWQRVREKEEYAEFRSLIQQKYEENRFDGSIPEISFKTWLRSETDGDLQEFWSVYFRRRHFVSYGALMALLYPEEPRYIEELSDVIWAICGEYSWVIPANVVFSTGGLNDFIDLFAAETAFLLAELSLVLSERLNPHIHTRIREEVKWRVLRNMKREAMLWETSENNWASVCGCNVGAAVMYLFPEEFPALLQRLQDVAFKSFFNSYSEEGTCLEGLGYWHYGLGTFMWFAELMREETGIDLTAGEKFRRMAAFGRRCFLKGDVLICFGDSIRHGRLDPGLMHCLRTRFPEDVKPVPGWMLSFWPGNTPWLQVTRNLIWLNPSPEEGSFRPESMDLPDSHQVLIATDKYSLAIRGGDNSFDVAQHSDLGGFILTTDEGQILCDPGPGLYSRDYFDPALRPSCFGAGSRFHNVPLINGEGQGYGTEYTASISHRENRIEVDLTNAYPEHRRVHRMLLHTDDALTLTDSFDPDIDRVTENFVTLLPPREEDGVIHIGTSVLEYDSSLTPVIKSVTGEMHTCIETFYTVSFDLPRGTDSVTFTIRP